MFLDYFIFLRQTEIFICPTEYDLFNLLKNIYFLTVATIIHFVESILTHQNTEMVIFFSDITTVMNILFLIHMLGYFSLFI